MSVNILIVGGGSIGERHLRSFQQIGCDVALCETNLSGGCKSRSDIRCSTSLSPWK